jgi:hypothetical protein
MIEAAGFVQTKGVGSSFQCAMYASMCSRSANLLGKCATATSPLATFSAVRELSGGRHPRPELETGSSRAWPPGRRLGAEAPPRPPPPSRLQLVPGLRPRALVARNVIGRLPHAHRPSAPRAAAKDLATLRHGNPGEQDSPVPWDTHLVSSACPTVYQARFPTRILCPWVWRVFVPGARDPGAGDTRATCAASAAPYSATGHSPSGST